MISNDDCHMSLSLCRHKYSHTLIPDDAAFLGRWWERDVGSCCQVCVLFVWACVNVWCIASEYGVGFGGEIQKLMSDTLTPNPLLANHVPVWIRYMNPNPPLLTLEYMHPPYFALQAQMKKHTTDGLAASTRASSRLHAVSWHWKASHKMCSSARLFWNACTERYHLPLNCSSSWLVTIETHFRYRLSKKQRMHSYMYAQSTQCAESTEHHALYVRAKPLLPVRV